LIEGSLGAHRACDHAEKSVRVLLSAAIAGTLEEQPQMQLAPLGYSQVLAPKGREIRGRVFHTGYQVSVQRAVPADGDHQGLEIGVFLLRPRELDALKDADLV